MNYPVVLALAAGSAIAFQTVFNSFGMRFLGLGAMIGVSAFITSLLGFVTALFLTRPEVSVRAIYYAAASGLIGAFVLAAIVLAANRAGLAQTLSLLIVSQLMVGLLVDRLGFFGPTVQSVGPLKALGCCWCWSAAYWWSATEDMRGGLARTGRRRNRDNADRTRRARPLRHLDSDDTKNYLSKEVWMSPPLKRISRMVFEHHYNLGSACAPNHPHDPGKHGEHADNAAGLSSTTEKPLEKRRPCYIVEIN
jgi:transporter family-2 protein